MDSDLFASCQTATTIHSAELRATSIIHKAVTECTHVALGNRGAQPQQRDEQAAKLVL